MKIFNLINVFVLGLTSSQVWAECEILLDDQSFPKSTLSSATIYRFDQKPEIFGNFEIEEVLKYELKTLSHLKEDEGFNSRAQIDWTIRVNIGHNLQKKVAKRPKKMGLSVISEKEGSLLSFVFFETILKNKHQALYLSEHFQSGSSGCVDFSFSTEHSVGTTFTVGSPIEIVLPIGKLKATYTLSFDPKSGFSLQTK